MTAKNQLPYYQAKNKNKEIQICKSLKRIYRPAIIKSISGTTSFFENKPRAYRDKIILLGKQKKFFLRIDVSKYYPSIDHKVLKKDLSSNYKMLTSKNKLSRKMDLIIKSYLPAFLSASPFRNKGLPIGCFLSCILSELYLFGLDKKLSDHRISFLRFRDDLLIFSKKQNEIKHIMKNLIMPELSRLKLEINPNKAYSGKIGVNNLEFMGFIYHGCHFSISDKKQTLFKKKINRLTILPKKTSPEALIKRINRLIKGFGHFYKFSHCKNQYAGLDSYIRKRIRRKLVHTRNNNSTINNLYLTNQDLSNLGLKSLIEIKNNFEEKKGKKTRKIPSEKKITTKRKVGQASNESLLSSLNPKLEAQNKNVEKLKKDVAGLRKEVKKLRKTVEEVKSFLEPQ